MTLHPVVRRGLRLLGASYALAWVATTMTVAPGSSAWVELSGRTGDAGAFIAVFYLALAAGALGGGRAMDRWGRRPVLALGHALAAVGFLAAGLAYGARSLGGFAAATVVLAAGMGAVNLTRLAAADLFPGAMRGRGVAFVQLSALFGAVVGPLLLVLSEPLGALLGRAPQSLVWFIAPPLLALAAALVLAGPEPLAVARDLPRYHPGAAPAPTPTPPAGAATARLPLALVALGVLVLASAQAGMAAVMGVSAVAAGHAGHGVPVVGGLMAVHFVGMFGLSLQVGRVADRVGRRATLVAGIVTIAVGAAATAVVPGVLGYGVGLLVVGVGWSFAYIGATVLLTDVAPPARRARVLGAADLVTAVVAASGAAAAGWWYAGHGLGGMGLAVAAAMLLPLVAALAIRERRPGVYALALPEAPAPPAPATPPPR